MGVQIPRRVHPEVPTQNALRRATATPRPGFSDAYEAEGKLRGGRASHARSCAHDAVDPAEVRGVAGRRVHEGQERDSCCPNIRRAETQLRRAALLGPRLLRLD